MCSDERSCGRVRKGLWAQMCPLPRLKEGKGMGHKAACVLDLGLPERVQVSRKGCLMRAGDTQGDYFYYRRFQSAYNKL